MDRSSTVRGVVIVTAVAWFGLGVAFAQDSSRRHRSQNSSRDGQRSDRGGQNSSRDGQRSDRRDGHRPSMANPEDRERFYDHMVDRYMERVGQDYQLTDAQKPQVRAQLEQLKQQQRAYSEPRRQEFESLRNEMRQLHENARSGGQTDSQRSKEITDRMRALWQEAPLFNPQRVTEQVEQLLPPDQVQRGRVAQQQRRQQDQNSWQQRREEMRQRWQQRQQQQSTQTPESPAGPGAAQPQAPMAPQDGAASGDERHSHRSRRTHDDASQQYQPSPSARQDSGDDNRGRHSHSGDQNTARSRQSRGVVEDPVGSWERYVREFSRRYQLDTSQQATAQSVLRSMQESRTAYEQSKRADFQAAQQIPDEKQRQQRLTELNAPLADLFRQLKSRLDQIPTAAQRQAVEGSPTPAPPPAVSQQQAPPPTAAGSQPAQ